MGLHLVPESATHSLLETTGSCRLSHHNPYRCWAWRCIPAACPAALLCFSPRPPLCWDPYPPSVPSSPAPAAPSCPGTFLPVRGCAGVGWSHRVAPAPQHCAAPSPGVRSPPPAPRTVRSHRVAPAPPSLRPALPALSAGSAAPPSASTPPSPTPQRSLHLRHPPKAASNPTVTNPIVAESQKHVTVISPKGQHWVGLMKKLRYRDVK